MNFVSGTPVQFTFQRIINAQLGNLELGIPCIIITNSATTTTKGVHGDGMYFVVNFRNICHFLTHITPVGIATVAGNEVLTI